MTTHNLTRISASLLVLGLFAGSASGEATGKLIPQPIVEGLKVALDSARVDLTLPAFSNSTKVTNPHFPVASQESLLFVGKVDGKPFRTEVTLLPYTRLLQWEGVQIEALVSQYVAFLDGRIEEAAIDLYAQADDGSVWYLGEDVSDFKDGVIISQEGTWHAGQDGPPAMIMPAEPKVGNVYRTENMPGIAFEEVTVIAMNETLDGPFGPVKGGMVGRELHFGGGTEDKQFGPGYGEFYTKDADGDVEALAMAVPTDRAMGSMPPEIPALAKEALAIFTATGGKDWKAVAAAMKEIKDARGRLPDSEVPKLVRPQLDDALDTLAAAVAQRHVIKTRNAAIEMARWSLDLQLRYRAAIEIDLARLDLWAAQLLSDAAAGKVGAVRGDTYTLVLTKDRVTRGLKPEAAQRINLLFGELQPAAKDEDLAAAADVALRLRSALAELATGN